MSILSETRTHLFAGKPGEKVAVVSGYTHDRAYASGVLFTDRRAVGFWGAGDRELVGGPVNGVALSAAHALLRAQD